MQHLEVSGAVRTLKWSLGVKWLSNETAVVLALQNILFLSVKQASDEIKQTNTDNIYIYIPIHITDVRRLTTGIRSEKFVVRLFRRCANVYLHKLDSIAYYTPRLYGIAYYS